MIHRPRWRDRLSRLAPWLLALGLFAVSMVVARTFAPPPGTAAPGSSQSAGPGSSLATGPYDGPALLGVFTGCNPACDLEVATEGIGRRLTFTDRAIDESAPSLAPDGAAVAYRCAEPGVEPGGTESPRPAGPGSICVIATAMPGEGAPPVPPTTILSDPTIDYGGPDWSPDGSTIAFHFRTAAGETGIGTWDLLRGVARTVTLPGVEASNPAWSPDGATLAFACGVVSMPAGGNTARFCAMPSEGGDETQIGGVDGDCGAPTFAPDAVHLAVVCIVPGAEGGDVFFLALSEPTSHQITGSGQIAPEGQRRVAFSPDGRLVYVRRGDALWALDPATETWSLPPLPPLHGDFDLQAAVE
jgi:hypothetical protein